MSKKNKLTLKQQLFCDWYIKLGHITNAAIKAGYSEKTAYSTGSENLKKPEIIVYIQQRKKELEELLGFNKATVIQDLLDIKDKSMQAKPVMYYNPKDREYQQRTEENDKGIEVGLYQYDSQGAIKALENVSKMMDYYAPTNLKHSNDPDNPMPEPVAIYIPDNRRDTHEPTDSGD